MEIETYEIVKIIHIIAVISWFVGLLYLPRLFVYHIEVVNNPQANDLFKTMERKLMRFIMLPAMLTVFASGLYLALQIGFEFGWLHIKITIALLVAAYHGFLSKCRKNFAQDQNKHNQKFYRIINEVPTILMIIIVTLVILKPF